MMKWGEWDMYYHCKVLNIEDEEMVTLKIDDLELTGFMFPCQVEKGEERILKVTMFDDVSIFKSEKKMFSIKRVSKHTYIYEITGILDVDNKMVHSIIDFDLDDVWIFNVGWLDGKYVQMNVPRFDIEIPNSKDLLKCPLLCKAYSGEINIIDGNNIQTTLLLDDYIPLEVVIHRECPKHHMEYFVYEKANHSLLEFKVDVQTHLITQMTLVICNEYALFHQKFEINTFENGDIQMLKGKRNICESFRVNLYENAVQVIVSNGETSKYIRMDQLYVGVSIRNEITNICLCDLKYIEVMKIKEVLDFEHHSL